MKSLIGVASTVNGKPRGATTALENVIECLTFGVDFDQSALAEAYMADKYGNTVGVEQGDFKVMTKEEMEAEKARRQKG